MGLLSVPLKTVLMYHADLQNEAIPVTYAVCDGTTLTSGQQDINPGGTYTLPDLRNRFILGADPTKAAASSGGTTNASSDAPGPKGTGGQHSKSLVVAELASHNHTGTISSAGSHTHAGSTADSGGAHTHTASTTTAGAHTHAGSTSNSVANHTHSGSTTDSQGSHSHTLTDPGHTHTIGSQTGGQVSGNAGGNWHDGSTATSSSTTGITVVANGAHTHTPTIAADGGHSHSLTLVSDGDHNHTLTVNSGGAHGHTLTLSSDGAHTHTFAGDLTGSGTAFDTRPRYYGIVLIMKVQK